MADPILPGIVRVQAVFQGVSQLPEDRYVNTFAFAVDAALSDAGKNACIDRVEEFYFATFNGGTVAQYMSTHPVHEQTSHFNAYSLEEPPQRTPLTRLFDSGFGLGTSQPLPSEVALCLSYYAGANQPRSRGRIYIGPLGTNAMATASATPSRVAPEFIGTLAAAGAFLIDQPVSTEPVWSIVTLPDSGTAKIARLVTNVWVDNAFDTQHRRGEIATLRTALP